MFIKETIILIMSFLIIVVLVIFIASKKNDVSKHKDSGKNQIKVYADTEINEESSVIVPIFQ